MLFSFIVIRSQLPIFRKATSSGLKTILIFVLVLNFHAKNGDVWQNFPSVVMLLLWVRSPTECVRVMASYAGTRGEVVTKAPWTDQQTVSPGWAERVRCTDSSAREWRHYTVTRTEQNTQHTATAASVSGKFCCLLSWERGKLLSSPRTISQDDSTLRNNASVCHLSQILIWITLSFKFTV